MKKIIIYLLATVMIFLTGCGETAEGENGAYENIQKKLVEMKSYKCKAEIKYISNNNETSYSTIIYCKTDGPYRIETLAPKELEGGIIVFDGKMIWQYNPKVESKISAVGSDKPERKEILISSFIKNYVKSQETTVETSQFNEGLCTVLDAKIPGDKKYFSTEKLWIDNKTLSPVRLVIFDKDGKEIITADFEDFEYNPELKDDLFKLY